MCDCYDHKCKVCDVTIPMHLADFNTSQDEIEVFCPKHTPKDLSKGCLWYVTHGKHNYDEGLGGKKIFIKALTANAKENCEGNHPNVGDPILVKEFGNKVKKSFT